MKPQKIESFKIDHNKLNPGIYVSRTDGDIVTYDLRTRKPNMGDYMDNATMHSVEHMIATYIRSSSIGRDIIYFGPMGCQTGFYLLVRNGKNEEVLAVLKETLQKVISHEGDVFGASQIECGNYKNLDISLAKEECRRYLDILSSYTPDFKYEV
ncbi:MAG: S-ribosylhomocysteine lyase [Ruminococcaceae bacterium]|nr:S-ribosylhomocysteine lyase [Oscillospiraceae bacterium]